MPSHLDDQIATDATEHSVADAFFVWNRRIHYYLGLYFLFFTWLFVFTGLLLNHPRWNFAQFWPNRVQTITEHSIQPLTGASLFESARDVMRQLGIAGELQWPAQRSERGVLAFQVSRPGLILDIKANLEQRRATVQRNQLNGWGVVQLLHTFTGMPAADVYNGRDWVLTTVWALSMDAVALGLIVMVLSSYVMWYRLKAKRISGILALLLGLVGCGAFLGAFGWLV
jgi:hypothetical protein